MCPGDGGDVGGAQTVLYVCVSIREGGGGGTKKVIIFLLIFCVIYSLVSSSAMSRGNVWV